MVEDIDLRNENEELRIVAIEDDTETRADVGNVGTLIADKARSRGEPTFNVKAYGAAGDGETDDSAAIQAAIDDAADVDGGGIVYYPTPDTAYLIENSLRPKSGTHHIGDGYSTIKASGLGNESMFHNRDGPNNVLIEGLEFDGTDGWADPDTYTPHKKGIYIDGDVDNNPENLVIRNCYVHDTHATAIGCDSVINDKYLWNKVENAGTEGEQQGSNGIGIGIGEKEGYAPTYVIGNEIVNTSQQAIIIEQTGDSQVAEGAFIAYNVCVNARDGIAAEHIEGFTIHGNSIKECSRHGIIIETVDGHVPAKYGAVRDNNIRDIGNDGIAANHSDMEQVFIEGNSFVSIGDTYINEDATTPVVVNGLGKEDAGEGNSPSESMWDGWARGCIVRNYSDNTFWLRYYDNWFKISEG